MLSQVLKGNQIYECDKKMKSSAPLSIKIPLCNYLRVAFAGNACITCVVSETNAYLDVVGWILYQTVKYKNVKKMSKKCVIVSKNRSVQLFTRLGGLQTP